MFAIRGTVSAAVIVDERHTAERPLQRGTFPQSRASRVFNDDITPVSTCETDESAADLEELAETLLLVWVMLTGVISDGLCSARNTEP